MSRFLYKIGFFFLLISILMSFSCAKKEVKEFGEYEEVSIDRMDMLVRGNCMPIELDGISINTTIKVAGGRIVSLSFLSSTEVIFSNTRRELYIWDFESGSKRQLKGSFHTPNASDLDQLFNHYNFFQMFTHNRNEILIFGRDGNFKDLTISALFINVEDDSTWLSDPQDFTGNYDIVGIRFDESDYLIFKHDDQQVVEVLALGNQGEFDTFSTLQGYDRLFFNYSGDHIFYLVDPSNGPYYTERGNEGYTDMEIWNENWDEGFGAPIIDASDRFIGIKTESLVDGDYGSFLVILAKGDKEPVITDFDRDLDLDLYETFTPSTYNYKCASDGDTVVFTSSHYLLKYSDGELRIWHDNLQDYGDNWEIRPTGNSPVHAVEYRDDLDIRCLFTDHDSSNFIMLLNKAVLYGGDEIEVIDLDSTISSNLQFTPDFQRACLALEDGSIVVLDIEGTPVDQL